MSYRAAKAGLARDTQVKGDNSKFLGVRIFRKFTINSQFDVDEARKCLYWLGEMIGENIEILDTENKSEMADSFYTVLRDGVLLCKLIDCLLPGDKKIDFSKKTFQATTNAAFAAARERERIGIFLQKCHEYGIPDTNTFQTDYLYERQNLVQVCTCIRAVGIEAQSHPDYQGPAIWPRKSETNRRTWTEDQLKAGQQVISLQYGTNKGASQAGMSFGKTRMIID